MAAATQISSPLRCYASIRDGGGITPAQTLAFARVPCKFGTVFSTGCPLLIQKPFYQRFTAQNSKSVSIRCEQNTKEGNGLDIWIGRLAMVGFTAAISIEIATGKGLLENVGLITPLPIAPRKQALMAIGVDEEPSRQSLRRIGEISAVEEFVYLKL